jgi:putative FmdB family regulatory protein
MKGSGFGRRHEDAMPLYEYRCEACGETEEKLESFSAPTEHACPKCGKAAGMLRQISRAAFTLSGSGWYAKDYASGSKKESSETPAAPSAPPSDGGCCGGCPHKHGA